MAANSYITDCVTLELLRVHQPAVAKRLRVLAFTQESLGLPYVTDAASTDENVADMREGS